MPAAPVENRSGPVFRFPRLILLLENWAGVP
jgi:hypothetical protein